MENQHSELDSVFEKVGKGLFKELTPDEELIFYREVINRVNATIYINQIDNLDDFTTARHIWVNQRGTDLMGYTIEEAYALGHHFFATVLHPEDLSLGEQSMDYHKLKKGDSFGGVLRQITRDRRTLWCHGNSIVLHERNGAPLRFLNISMNIQNESHTQHQLFELQKENIRLTNQLLLQQLSSREKEVLRLIGTGKSDKQISRELNLSYDTARTHRKNILRKLGKHKTAELVCFAVENGLN